MAYITYTEYTQLGGTASESAFTSLIYPAETKLDYLTNGRIKTFDEDDIPDAVKYVCVRIINLLNSVDIDRDTNVSSYSNGIETFSYGSDSSAKGSTGVDNKIASIIKEYLWEYPELLYRGRVQWRQK